MLARTVLIVSAMMTRKQVATMVHAMVRSDFYLHRSAWYTSFEEAVYDFDPFQPHRLAYQTGYYVRVGG